jgi:spoIIIJ-associated protein
MQDQTEATGKSPEDALENGLAALGARRADVRWEVLQPGGARLFGLLGARTARVRIERLVRRHADAHSLVVDLLAAMEIAVEVQTRQGPDMLEITIQAPGMDGLLIGKRGETLAALQHVIGRMVSKEFGFHGTVMVDVGGYRGRREAQLADKARILAEKAKATGRDINLEPLHALDRRVVHNALAEISGVRRYTVGRGLHRNVVIAPDPRATPPAS